MIKNLLRFCSVNWALSLFLNCYYFTITKAFHFPILVGYGTKIGSLGDRNSIQIPTQFGALCFGLKKEPFKYGNNTNYWYIGRDAQLILKGTCRMAKGIRIKLFEHSKLIIGSHFTSNANLLISCAKTISFGADNLLGWDITIMDNDGGHSIVDIDNNTSIHKSANICIGNHVWIGSKCSILKGSCINNGSIIGYGSLVCGMKTIDDNSLVIGAPSSVKKTKISWNH